MSESTTELIDMCEHGVHVNAHCALCQPREEMPLPAGCPTCYFNAINQGLARAGKPCDLHADHFDYDPDHWNPAEGGNQASDDYW